MQFHHIRSDFNDILIPLSNAQIYTKCHLPGNNLFPNRLFLPNFILKTFHDMFPVQFFTPLHLHIHGSLYHLTSSQLAIVPTSRNLFKYTPYLISISKVTYLVNLFFLTVPLKILSDNLFPETLSDHSLRPLQSTKPNDFPSNVRFSDEIL